MVTADYVLHACAAYDCFKPKNFSSAVYSLMTEAATGIKMHLWQKKRERLWLQACPFQQGSSVGRLACPCLIQNSPSISQLVDLHLH